MNNFSHIPANVISLAQRIAAVENKPLFPPLDKTAFKAVTKPLYFTTEENAFDQIGARPALYDVPKHVGRVITRTDNGQPLSIVGSKYAIVQNSELQATVAEAAEAALPRAALQDIELGEFTSHGGRYTRFEYTFPALGADIRQLSGSSTQLKFRIGIVNGFGGSSIRGFAGAYDLICTNGMVIGEFETSAYRHTAGFNPAKLGAFIEAEAAKYQTRVRVWQEWARKEINLQQAEATLTAAGLSPKRVIAMMAQFEAEAVRRGASVWALYSALTFYSSHNSDAFGVRNSGSVDNVAETLDKREREVARVITSEAFQRLAA
jgi:hypothetical protein